MSAFCKRSFQRAVELDVRRSSRSDGCKLTSVFLSVLRAACRRELVDLDELPRPVRLAGAAGGAAGGADVRRAPPRRRLRGGAAPAREHRAAQRVRAASRTPSPPLHRSHIARVTFTFSASASTLSPESRSLALLFL